jgi:hypothetical protein
MRRRRLLAAGEAGGADGRDGEPDDRDDKPPSRDGERDSIPDRDDGRLGPDARDEPRAGVYNIEPKPPETLAPDLIEEMQRNDLNPDWMDEIAKRETAGQPHDGWGTVRRDPDGNEALGRFQMTKPALQDAGLIDKNGDWTGKYGVNNREDFLNNPEAQKAALRDHTESVQDQLRKNGAERHINQKIDGVKGEITATDGGLQAAAHRQGATTVRDYLKHQEAHGWKSDASTFPPQQRGSFLSVETRLREFQSIPRSKR